MKSKKILILIYMIFAFICTGCTSQGKIISYNENVQVRGLTLKTSLIQTAYELYNINVANPNDYNEDLYKKSTKDAQKHYKWLKKTYASMDNNMKNKLDNIFSTYNQWDYINEVINLDDNADKDEILNQIISSEYLSLSKPLKEDLISFYNYFYDESFDSYYFKHEVKYAKKSNEINKILVDNNIDVIKFVENVSGFDFEHKYQSIFYYSFNPFQTQVFKYDNTIISTVQSDVNAQDILSICFYQYSQYIFDNLANNYEFIEVCQNLKNDPDFINEYKKLGQTSYDFNSWCRENLVAGFSKYLDYRYCQSDYQFNSYVFDLDFYNYLRAENFNPNDITLTDVCIGFYQDKVNTLLASYKN